MRAPIGKYCSRRRGSVYVIVLVAAGTVTFAGMASLSLARARMKQRSNLSDGASARSLIHAALALGSQRAANSDVWRSSVQAASGVVIPKTSFGGGTVVVEALAPAGKALTDGLDVPVTLRATTTMGSATQHASWLLDPVLTWHAVTTFGLYCDGKIAFKKATVRSDLPIAAEDDLQANESLVFADVRSRKSVSGSTFVRGSTSSTPSVGLPSTGLLGWYTSKLTAINLASIPSSRITNACLGPGVNPYGASNPLGLYYIDANNKDFAIQRSRIVGMLCIVNAHKVRIETDVLIQGPSNGYPTLIIQADEVTWAGTDTLLQETSAKGNVNFNPAGMPFDGTSDADVTDTYTPGLEGLIYLHCKLYSQGTCHVRGCLVVAEDTEITGNLNIWRSNMPAVPPPFFVGSASFKVRGDTFARVIP